MDFKIRGKETASEQEQVAIWQAIGQLVVARVEGEYPTPYTPV